MGTNFDTYVREVHKLFRVSKIVPAKWGASDQGGYFGC